MNCNFLAKKIISWFNENQNAKEQKDLVFRFGGKESYNYLQNFPLLFLNVIRRVNKTKKVTLMQVFYESIYLRKLVSISVWIDDINNNELSEMFMSVVCLLFPLRCFGVTKLMVFFNSCTTWHKISLPQIWFYLKYKHYGGKRTGTPVNNKILEKYHISKLLGWNFLPWIHAADIFKRKWYWFKKVSAVKNIIYAET